MAYVGRGVHKDLTTYLVAAHHGKVRTSIRSIPSERVRAVMPFLLAEYGMEMSYTIQSVDNEIAGSLTATNG